MTNNKIKKIVFSSIAVFIVLSIVTIIIAVYRANNTSKVDSTTQQTAPPYEGDPIVAFDDKTDRQLLNATGNVDYVNIKYFIGEYLATKGVAKDPIPRVLVSNFATDIVYLGTIGSYNNLYTFDAYSSDINTLLKVQMSTITSGDGQTTITILNDGFARPLNQYSYERY